MPPWEGTLSSGCKVGHPRAVEEGPLRKPHSNDNTIQHCRPKPNPSSTAVPVRHDPAQGDVRHQDAQEGTLARVPVQGGGQVQVEEEHVQRLLPAQGDVHPHYAKEGTLARVPGSK